MNLMDSKRSCSFASAKGIVLLDNNNLNFIKL